ncbi:hypothetical protein [Corynebacterium anserum]|uniref:Uncharacterized protein n=2 Tax=Corynebacterium anserum TaxID=2684406 RepID=A0A7G7YQH8_9CORY|nr:hypothetical protein [Corynebacterium anserum]QNH96748.1 hypothetical protein GP473_08880 [Corynebacterium anserum]
MVAGVGLVASVVLTGCGTDVTRYLDDNRTQYSEASVQDLYGGQWAEFSVQCPRTDAATIAQQLGIQPDQAEDTSERDDYQYLYMRNSAGDVETHSLKVGDVNFCGPAQDNDIDIAGWWPADLKLPFVKPHRKDDWQVDPSALRNALGEVREKREKAQKEAERAQRKERDNHEKQAREKRDQ